MPKTLAPTRPTMSYLSTYLKEIVYGGNDGIITTFAVVAGFTGAAVDVRILPVFTVLLFGFANLFADGVSMALGDLLSSRSQSDVYSNEKQKELKKIRDNPDAQFQETIRLLESKGFKQEKAQEFATLLRSNESYWVEFMMDQDVRLPNTANQNNIWMAVVTFISFVGFGVIPLLPYLLFRNISSVFMISCVFTVIAMLSLGVLRWRATGHALTRTVGETVVIGGLAAIVAYLVGGAFHI
ncbi:VIT1/CCC1 transporter family protein [Candidatus Woesebacteria bacterium]|nr:VIT1/CCC1 transporter family protein [Candidatus Woesebacteria bacterium]